jgi:hypothetical protein
MDDLHCALGGRVVEWGGTDAISMLNLTFGISEVIKDEGAGFGAERVCLVPTYGVGCHTAHLGIVRKNTGTMPRHHHARGNLPGCRGMVPGEPRPISCQ